jgi:peptidyl-prolyl cis-trans isomerase B (cyclophilin B)
MFGVRKMTRIQALVANGLVWMLAVQAWAFWDRAEVLAQNPRVLLETSMGDLEVELYQKEAPKTVANFLSYVKKGHYDGTIFHRIIPNFVVQGGGLDPSMKERPTDDPIENESSNGLKNDKMTLSMARTRAPHSATSQFYINLKYNSDLDKSKAIDRFGYCVFGKVIKGEDIVEKMAKSKTGLKAGNSDVPVEPIVLKKATILEPSKN